MIHSLYKTLETVIVSLPYETTYEKITYFTPIFNGNPYKNMHDLSYTGKKLNAFFYVFDFMGKAILPNEGKILGFSLFGNLNAFFYNKLGQNDPYHIHKNYDFSFLGCSNFSLEKKFPFLNRNSNKLFIESSNKTNSNLNPILLSSSLIEYKDSKMDKILHPNLIIDDEIFNYIVKKPILNAIKVDCPINNIDCKNAFKTIKGCKFRRLFNIIEGSELKSSELKVFDTYFSVLLDSNNEDLEDLYVNNTSLFLFKLNSCELNDYDGKKYCISVRDKDREQVGKGFRNASDVGKIVIEVCEEDRNLSLIKEVNSKKMDKLNINDFRVILREENLYPYNSFLIQLKNLPKNEINLRFNLKFLKLVYQHKFLYIYNYINMHQILFYRTYKELLDYKSTLKATRKMIYYIGQTENCSIDVRIEDLDKRLKLHDSRDFRFFNYCFENIDNPEYKKKILIFLDNADSSQKVFYNELFLLKLIRSLERNKI